MPWSRVHDVLAAGLLATDVPVFLSTVRPDGRPHSASVGLAWYEGDLYVLSGRRTRKSRNLAGNPACTISTRLPGIDVVFEGNASLVTDQEMIEALAMIYRDGGFPAEAADGAITAPFIDESAGPPPWHLFRIHFHTVFGVGTEEPLGAMRWRFEG
jgi:hypothetical protein